MTLLDAVSIIEDADEDTHYHDLLEAWSFIARGNHHLHLQGWYGRVISRMIEAGELTHDGLIPNRQMEDYR